jgi:hypothetical protein
MMGALFTQTILSYGNSALYMKVNVVKRSINLLTIPVGIFFGIKIFILSIVIISYIGFLIDIFFTSKILGTKKLDYIKELTKPLVFTGVMFAAISLIQKFLFINTPINLIIESIIAVILYSVLLYFIANEVFKYFLDFLKSFIKKV